MKISKIFKKKEKNHDKAFQAPLWIGHVTLNYVCRPFTQKKFPNINIVKLLKNIFFFMKHFSLKNDKNEPINLKWFYVIKSDDKLFKALMWKLYPITVLTSLSTKTTLTLQSLVFLNLKQNRYPLILVIKLYTNIFTNLILKTIIFNNRLWTYQFQLYVNFLRQS